MSFQDKNSQVSTKLSSSQLQPRVAELLTMLTYMRPAGGVWEAAFINRYIAPTGAVPDAYGNLWLRVGDSPILWSCHTDTVHRTDGKQRVTYGAGIATSDSGECLGADCTTGVWIMLQMIRAGVPGLYVFHRAEECGRLGSQHVAENFPDRLAGIKFAIAFDRKGYKDVITCQGPRTCSDAFAQSFADALPDLELSPCPHGIYTDTLSYIGLVGECTNVSVGYGQAHSAGEFQDVHFACRLADALLSADFSGLVASRKPGDPDDSWSKATGFKHSRFQSFECMSAPIALENFCYDNPNVVADFLHECGFSVADLKAFAAGDESYTLDAQDWLTREDQN